MQPSSSLWAGAYRRQTWASVNGWWCVDLPPAQLLHCCQDSAFHERVLRWSMDIPAIRHCTIKVLAFFEALWNGHRHDPDMERCNRWGLMDALQQADYEGGDKQA